ncbi:hypothetical protein [Flavobacterium sp.]|uniref:hypothetical protein n=1 Tax=Flavobacterium sp. TaxID=239 RepID=UPI00263350B4|nr:hypothetical protein [Flavobacterium sp.]
MNKEDFINNVFNSVDGITKVIPNNDLFSRIERKIARKDKVSIQTIWLVAASIVILLSLNLVLLNYFAKSNHSEIASLELVINKNNQLYK